MYVCMYVDLWMYAHVCMHMQVHVRIQTYTRVCICIYIYENVCLHSDAWMVMNLKGLYLCIYHMYRYMLDGCMHACVARYELSSCVFTYRSLYMC